MTNLVPVSSFDDVPQIEVTTPLLGGSGGPLNGQAQALINRTEFLSLAKADNLPGVIFADQFDTLSDAVNSLPDTGGVVLLPGGVTEPHIGTITKKNVCIMGVGNPDFLADSTGLSGGSIVIGPLIVDADGFKFISAGVDSGSAVCNSRYAGEAQEGLSMGNTGSVNGRPQRTGAVIHNATMICKENTSPHHAALFENLTGADIQNIKTRFGQHGVVMKLTHSNVNNLRCDAHGTNGAIIKSDTYAPCYNNNISNIVCTSQAAYGGGIRYQAATSDMGQNNLTNLVSIGGSFGMAVEANPGNITGLNLSNVSLQGNEAFGFITNSAGGGFISASSFDGIYSANSGADGITFRGVVNHSTASNCRSIASAGDSFNIAVSTLGFALNDCKSIFGGGHAFKWTGADGVSFDNCTDYASALGLTDAAYLPSLKYKEGSFTPSVIGNSVAGECTYAIQVGSFRKVGSLVSLVISLEWSGHTGSGSMYIAGLPFGASASLSYTPALINHNLPMGAGTQLIVRLDPLNAYLTMVSTNSTTGEQAYKAISASGSVQINIQYHV